MAIKLDVAQPKAVAPVKVAVTTAAASAPVVAEPAAAKTWVGNPSTSASGPQGQAALGRLQQLNSALSASQNTGTLGTAVANAMTLGAYGSAAKKLEEAIGNVNALAERLIAKDGGKLSNKSAQLLEQAIDFAAQNLKDQGELRGDVVNTTANVATTAVLTVAAVPSGGASIAALATIGAGTKAGSKVAMEGTGYTHADAAKDLATGAAEGAAAGVLSKVAQGKVAANTAAAHAKSAKSVMDDLSFEFVRVNGRQDPAVLKPLMAQVKQLEAAGHVFTKAEQRLVNEITRYLGGPDAGRKALAVGLESI